VTLRITSNGLDASIRLLPAFASLEVSAPSDLDLLARALFSELEAELKRRAYDFSWIARWINGLEGYGVNLGVGVTFAAIWMLLGAAVAFALGDSPRQRSGLSDWLLAVPIAFGLIVVLVKAFPGVRFTGHFLDSSQRVRRVLYVATFSILVPILIRFGYDHWKRR
jgi:hypothetical protein